MKRQAGFSLLELMTTLAVLAIVLSVGVPSMRNAVEKRNAMSAAEAIYSEIQLARSESIARTQNVYMNIVGGSTWAMGVSDDQNCDPSDNAPACTLTDMDGNNPITHLYTVTDNNNVQVTTTSNQISFSPQRGTASNAVINVTSTGDRGYSINLNVTVLGQVSICSPNTDPVKYVSGYRVCS